MRIIWDPRKAALNYEKHGIRFSDAELVLFDPGAITRDDPASRDEQRFITIGADVIGRIVVVVYSYRGDDIRLISARPATTNERMQYEEGIRFQ